MSYLVNTSRVSTLTINGVDRTNIFKSFQCADSTANRTGLITTKGSVVLGLRAGGLDISTYNRLLFRRGQVVILDMKGPSGTVYRHPRGYLYVLSTSYSPENDEVVIEVGCRIALMELTEEIDALLSYPEFTLPEENRDFGNISTALALTGHIVYQNNQGALAKRKFFPANLQYGSNVQGAWASFLGITTLNVAPLSNTGALPDWLDFQYTLPGDSSTQVGDIITDTTTSQYYIAFPMKTYTRILRGNFNTITGTTTSPRIGTLTTDCGTNPNPPNIPSGLEPCTDNFEVVDSTTYLSVSNTSIQTTYNTGPGGQTSRIVQEVYGPALEVNSQFFTDKYGFCVQSYSSTCSNFCRPDGENTVLQGRTITEYFYGSDGEVTSTFVTNYKHLGAAAIPSDWRASYKDDETGETIETWKGDQIDSILSSNRLYRDSLVVTSYAYDDQGGTTEYTATYTSMASRGVGLSIGRTFQGGIAASASSLDALRGIVTRQTRTSRITSTNPSLPDRTNNAAESTNEGVETVSSFPVFVSWKQPAYTNAIEEAGPYVIRESLPIDLLQVGSLTPAQLRNFIQDTAQEYGNYLSAWLRGENLGLRISEALREDFVTTWYPGQPFWYHDPNSGEVLVMLADAGSWAVAEDGAVVTFQGVWIGISNGTPVLPENTLGGF